MTICWWENIRFPVSKGCLLNSFRNIPSFYSFIQISCQATMIFLINALFPKTVILWQVGKTKCFFINQSFFFWNCAILNSNRRYVWTRNELEMRNNTIEYIYMKKNDSQILSIQKWCYVSTAVKIKFKLYKK